MMKPYSSYKNTNIEWLEQIPNLWEVLPLKRVIDKFVDYRGHTPNKTDSGILLITARNIRDGHLDFDKSREHIAEEDYDSWMVRGMPEKGDVMVTTEAPLGAIAQIESENVALAQRLILLKANKNRMNNTFIKYYFLSQFGQNMLLSEGTGSTAIGIKASKFYNINIIIPPISEQQAIADFLDRKTTQIDTLIEKKQRQIDLLQEQRTALINHAVTKGLNPDVRMKDSGVDWLGEIPSHWESSKLKFLVDIRYGLGQPPKELENGLPIIRATNVERGKIVSKDMVYIDPSDVPPSRNAILKENEIIVVRSGAYTADSAIVTKEYSGAVAGYDMVVTPTSISAQLLAYAFLSHYVLKNQLYLQRMRAAQPHLNAEELGDTLIVYPPSEKEQIEIENYLDDTTKKISETIARTNEQIDLLREYRTALISEAVTGKIDVRIAV